MFSSVFFSINLGVSYVTVDASAVEVDGNGGGLLHLENVYPSTSGMQMR
jgi:hypothetical protein